MTETVVTIGKIVAPHGVRGDVRVVPLTDFPERFQATKQVRLEDGAVLTISSVKKHKQFILVKFKDLDSIEAVEHLRGKLLQVARKDAVKLPAGHFYIFDLIGLDVYTIDDEPLGKVTDVLRTGSNDVYVVENAEKVQVLIPALKEVVRQIDIENKRMIVKLQEEWEA